MLLTLVSPDGLNRLTRRNVRTLTQTIAGCVERNNPVPLIITGEPASSSGADLNEIAELSAIKGSAFAKMGQSLMAVIENYPAPVYAAVRGFCMGGGLDLALACHRRIAAPP